MLKKILLAVAVAIPMFASAQTVKIGIVDTNAVFQAMPEENRHIQVLPL